MANYVISYDLNGPTPSHASMDQHMKKAGWIYGRILETVWYVATKHTTKEVFDYINSILSNNDRLIVVHAQDAHLRNLLIKTESIQAAWPQHV